jgi:hypothetical protein
VFTISIKFGIPLSLEEVPLTYGGDLVDVTSPQYHPKGPEDRAYNPRGGPLDVVFEMSPTDDRPADAGRVLKALLDAYAANRYPGTYRLTSVHGVFHVLPESVRDKDGQPRQLLPLMETSLTVPASATRTTAGLIGLILRDLALETGTRVVLGRAIPGSLDESLAPNGFVNTPARDILEAALEGSGGHRLWLLLWDPTFHNYVFSIF